jgi:hypothetical protein
VEGPVDIHRQHFELIRLFLFSSERKSSRNFPFSAAELTQNTENYFSVLLNGANWIGHILRRNCLLKHVIEGKLKGRIEMTVRKGRRRKQLLHDLKEKEYTGN